jgi:hypothetical protein
MACVIESRIFFADLCETKNFILDYQNLTCTAFVLVVICLLNKNNNIWSTADLFFQIFFA